MVYILVLGSSGGMVDGEKLKTEQPETTVKEQLVDVEGKIISSSVITRTHSSCVPSKLILNE